MANSEIVGNLLKIEFENNTMPVVAVKSNKPYLYWGQQNNYPSYLLELYKRNAYHGAIIKTKTEHIYGKGLCYDKDELTLAEQIQYDNFLSKANRFEDWNSIFRKNTTPFELFDGVALQVIYNFNGKCEVYAMEFAKLRLSPDGKTVYYCDKWINDDGTRNINPERHDSFQEYPIFNPQVRTGTQVLYYKLPTLTAMEYGDIYPEPNYLQCCQDIETDIEITNFHYSNTKQGFSASAMLSLFNGEPTEAEKKKYSRLFENRFTGTSNAGKIIFNFVNQGGQEAKITSLTASDLDKQFEILSKRLQQNILTGHRVDPALAGIFSDTMIVGDNTVYLQKYDRWVKSYIEHRQAIHIEIIQMIGEVNGVDLSKLEVKQKAPASLDLPYDTNLLTTLFDAETLKKHYAKQLGIDIAESSEVEVAKDSLEMEGVNEHLKNITAKQWIHIKRLVREVTKGKTSKDAAKMLIKNSYGLKDEDIELLFKAPESAFAKHNADKMADLFIECAIDDNPEDEILAEFEVKNGFEALEKENKFFRHQFANPYEDPTKLENAIIDMTSGNPYITPEEIAKQLALDLTVVIAAIESMKILGLLDALEGTIMPTPKAIERTIKPVKTEIYTVYKYIVRDDVPRTISGSRPFCEKLLRASNNGKRWTREAIDKLSNDMEDNTDAWSYRGGYYTNPDNGETTAYCRHIWKSVIKARKK
jgi:hypothetical protein